MPRRETHIPRIGELEVFSQQRTSGRDQGPLDYHSISEVEPVWITLESALDVALCLHETPEGIQALTDLGVLIVQGLFRLGNGHTFGNRNMSEMRRHVILFLQIVRRRFPQVYIRSSGRSDAITDRRMWGTDVDDYDPKVAARIYVRDWIVDEVIRDPSRANIFKFHLVIALAHEIVHLFVGYLTGDPNVLTPPNLSARGHGSSTAGESGNYWERTFLGGTLEMWFPRGSVEAPGSAHAYLLLETSRGPRMARRISPTYIDNMVNRRFSFPIQCSLPCRDILRTDLERQYRSTPYRAAAQSAPAVSIVNTRMQREVSGSDDTLRITASPLGTSKALAAGIIRLLSRKLPR